MINHAQLKAILAREAYTGMDAAAKLAALNEKNISYFIEPATADFDNFLRNTGLSLKLTMWYRDHSVQLVRAAAELALDLASSQIQYINIANQMTQQMIGVLVQGGVWTQDDADSVIAFATRYRSTIEAEFADGDVATETDLACAALVDKAAGAQTLIDASRQRTATLEALLADLQSGTDVDLEAVA